jgi:hypothetical protein
VVAVAAVVVVVVVAKHLACGTRGRLKAHPVVAVVALVVEAAAAL